MKNTKLQNAVIRRLGGRDYLEDVVNHGADAGYPGFTYCSDTVKFYRKHKSDIVTLAEEMADEFGQSVVDMVRGFNCIKNDYTPTEVAKVLYGPYKDTTEYTMIANAMAWFALEEVSRQLCPNL